MQQFKKGSFLFPEYLSRLDENDFSEELTYTRLGNEMPMVTPEIFCCN
jgi:hypothetical protein